MKEKERKKEKEREKKERKKERKKQRKRKKESVCVWGMRDRKISYTVRQWEACIVYKLGRKEESQAQNENIIQNRAYRIECQHFIHKTRYPTEKA